MTIGERIKHLRNQKGISMSDLAKAIGTNSSAISAWENNQKTPSTLLGIAIAQYFDVSLDWLLRGEEFQLSMNIPTESEGQYKSAMNIYERIEKTLSLKDLTLDDVVENTGVPFQWIRRWKKGVSEPSEESLLKIAGYLKVPPKWLTTGEDDNQFDNNKSIESKVQMNYLFKDKDIYDNAINLRAIEIYNRIESLSEERKMSLKEVSDQSNVSLQTINRWKHGKSDPSYNSIRSIADTLGVSFSYLANGNDTAKEFQKLNKILEVQLKYPEEKLNGQQVSNDNTSPQGQNIIDIHNKNQAKQDSPDPTNLWEQELKAMKGEGEDRSDLLKGAEQNNFLNQFNRLSERDKREIEEIIKLKLRLSKEFKE